MRLGDIVRTTVDLDWNRGDIPTRCEPVPAGSVGEVFKEVPHYNNLFCWVRFAQGDMCVTARLLVRLSPLEQLAICTDD